MQKIWRRNNITVTLEGDDLSEVMAGYLKSRWSSGVLVVTPAVVLNKTGEITSVSLSDEDTENLDLDVLEEEWFETHDGDRYDVCRCCHEWILMPIYDSSPVNSQDKTLFENKVCRNPDCDNYG